jgi:hypothetical protein
MTVDDIETVRERLAARGLIRFEPNPRIPEAPAPDPLADAEALEDPPLGPAAAVACPACRQRTEVVVGATGFRCRWCTKVWRWAACGSCAELAVVIARQESWPCGGCRAYTRSWWRTATAPREAQEIAERKKQRAAADHRARQLAAAQRRRWKLVGGGVAAVVVAGVGALLFTSVDTSSPAEQTRIACERFVRFKSNAANGTLTAGEIDAEIDGIAEAAESGLPEVQVAASRLAGAGRPGDAAFLVASTAMSDECSATA